MLPDLKRSPLKCSVPARHPRVETVQLLREQGVSDSINAATAALHGVAVGAARANCCPAQHWPPPVQTNSGKILNHEINRSRSSTSITLPEEQLDHSMRALPIAAARSSPAASSRSIPSSSTPSSSSSGMLSSSEPSASGLPMRRMMSCKNHPIKSNSAILQTTLSCRNQQSVLTHNDWRRASTLLRISFQLHGNAPAEPPLPPH